METLTIDRQQVFVKHSIISCPANRNQIRSMDNLHVRLTFNLGKTNQIFYFKKSILQLVELQVWWRNVIKHGKYSRAKFANLYIFVLREEKVTIFQLKLPQTGNFFLA